MAGIGRGHAACLAHLALVGFDQMAMLLAIGVLAESMQPFCGSFLMCGTPLETSAGKSALEKPDFEKARAILKEANYAGRSRSCSRAISTPASMPQLYCRRNA